MVIFCGLMRGDAVFVPHGIVLVCGSVLLPEIVMNYILEEMNFDMRAVCTIELECNVHRDAILPDNRCDVYPSTWSNSNLLLSSLKLVLSLGHVRG